VAAFLPAGLYTLNTIYNIFFTKPTGYTLKFILGIISSRCLGWFWRRNFFDQKATFPKIKKDALLLIPVPRLDFSNPADKARHDKLVSLVEKMMETRKQLSEAKTDGDKNLYTNKYAGLDGQIDALVYELYGLTQDEIKIVEGKNKFPVGQPLSTAPE
jgi:TaqI-like C-terminal specificity domain